MVGLSGSRVNLLNMAGQNYIDIFTILKSEQSFYISQLHIL